MLSRSYVSEFSSLRAHARMIPILLAILAIVCAAMLAFPSHAFAATKASASPAGKLAAGVVAKQSVKSTSNTANASQTSTKEKVFKGKGVYYILLAGSKNKVLGMKNESRVDGTWVVLTQKQLTNMVRFRLSYAGDHLYFVENIATGRFLSADLSASKKTGMVTMKEKASGRLYRQFRQRWRVVINEDGTVSFCVPRTKLRMNLANGNRALGTALRLKAAANERSQKFKLVKARPNANERVVLNVPCYMQNPQLPTGCESVALTNALNYWGCGLRKTEIAHSWMPYGGNGVVNFIGNPFNSSGWIICAPGITNTANKYLRAKGSKVQAVNISGTSMQDLRAYLDKGYPIVVWTTMRMRSPWSFAGSHYYGGYRYPFYHNNHAVVVAGYDPQTGNYLIADSLAGTVWRNGRSFTSIYNTMGKQAVVLTD